MWEFSNLDSNFSFLAAGDARQQNTTVYPSYENPHVRPCTANPSPGFEEHGSFLQFSSTITPRMSPPTPNPGNNSNSDSSKTKKLLFKRSRDEKIVALSSTTNPFDDFNPSLPPKNAAFAHTSTEMHEDTEEIDALLYSESDYLFNEEESSTGHSPLDMEDEASRSHHPAKRLRLDSAESPDLLMDTASSAISPSSLFVPDDDHIDPSSISTGRKKREKIQATVSALRRIIPGGKGKDTSSVLDEAIQYLKSLKLRAVAMGAISSSSP